MQAAGDSPLGEMGQRAAQLTAIMVTEEEADDPETVYSMLQVNVAPFTGVAPALPDTEMVAGNPPVITAPVAQVVGENQSLAFSSPLISVNDPDVGIDSEQISLTVTNGTLTLLGGTTSGLSFTANSGDCKKRTHTSSRPLILRLAYSSV